MTADTKARLLQAAERILIERGVHALTVRRIGEVSDLNPTLITYHFGSVNNLLQQLLEQNVAPMQEAWKSLDSASAGSLDVAGLLAAWLEPLLLPAAYNPGGRALIVVDEIASHGQAELSDGVMREMIGMADRVAQLLVPLLPALDPAELRLRLRFIAGAALGPPPRTRVGNTLDRTGDPALDGAALVRFAAAALSPQ